MRFEWTVSLVLLLLFFFFQAEDGIRDYKVTGVQTCALPISALCMMPRTAEVMVRAPALRTPRMVMQRCSASITTITPRSEERRVGKECRTRGGPEQEEKKGEDRVTTGVRGK